MDYLSQKIEENFKNIAVKKGTVNELFLSLSLPSFLRDWFLRKYGSDVLDISQIAAKLKEILPRSNEKNAILDKVISQNKSQKFIAKISVSIDIKTSEVRFCLPDFAINENETLIESYVWNKIRLQFPSTAESIWGVVELGYTLTKKGGKITLLDFKNFVPYNVDLKFYKEARKKFTIQEWLDVLLGACDYEGNAFESETQKMALLKRLLPFVEKRLNLIELAPKGTGKSYVFSQISKYAWLNSGGVMTRAKMFFDMSKKTDGLVANYDIVALDEVQTITFSDESEMRGALKGYLENGIYNVGNKSGKAESSIVLLGNIGLNRMDETTLNLFETLPSFFNESALIDRFHGFIKGWEMLRMSENMKKKDIALNSEYFAEIMHCLRNEVCYRNVVDDLIDVPYDADTRDTTAIKKIATAFLKLLFPHVEKCADIDINEFETYCFKPALEMRSIIRKQLSIMDKEYKEEITGYSVKFV